MNTYNLLKNEESNILTRHAILNHYKETYPDELSVKLGFTYADLDFIRRERHNPEYNNESHHKFATFNTLELNETVIALTSLTKGLSNPIINKTLKDSGAFEIIINQLINYYTLVNQNITTIYNDMINSGQLSPENQDKYTRRMQKIDYKNIQKIDILNNLI